MTYQKSANEIAAEYERREKAIDRGEPVNAAMALPKRGKFGAWVSAQDMLHGKDPDFWVDNALIQVQDGMIIVTDENGNLEFYPPHTIGFASYVRNSDEG